MGLRVERFKMEEQLLLLLLLLLLENPLLKVLLEDERSDWVNPIFDEREKCGDFHTLFHNAAGARTKISFSIL